MVEGDDQMKTIERLNRVDRSRLGARARMQRERLGLTRSAVAAEIGTSPLNLLNWEKMISNKQDNDHLWEQALRQTFDPILKPFYPGGSTSTINNLY